jgi:hypothetical protein
LTDSQQLWAPYGCRRTQRPSSDRLASAQLRAIGRWRAARPPATLDRCDAEMRNPSRRSGGTFSRRSGGTCRSVLTICRAKPSPYRSDWYRRARSVSLALLAPRVASSTQRGREAAAMATAKGMPADALDGAAVRHQDRPASALAHGPAKRSDIEDARRELGATEERAAGALEAAAARHRRHAAATKDGAPT